MSSLPTIERLLRAYADGSYFARLVHAPTPHSRRRAPELVFHAPVNAVPAAFTIVTPAYNAEATIAVCLAAAARTASRPFDWILIDDGSEDGTADRARSVLAAGGLPMVARATILRNPAPIFETACDNLGFWLAETATVVELQSDIEIREHGFDRLAMDALDLPVRPASVSGRCGHSFFNLRGRWIRTAFGGRREECVGLCGRLIETPEVIEPLRGRLYQCETVPRGPWVLRKADLERVGYLDERHFFLGNDDHDFHRRLFDATGRQPVYAPMALRSPLHLGAQRRTRAGVNRRIYAELKASKRGSPEFRRFLSSRRRPALPRPIA